MKQVSGQMNLFDLDMPCGRTSPAPSLPTKVKTSVSSSKSFAKSKTKAPMFLDLRTGSGNLAGASWETGIPWLGVSSMLNFGECPNVAEESGLWQILQENAPLKYYLSAKACAGVLRRAERRGKILPEILKTALEQQIERWEKYGSPLPQNIAMQKIVFPSCARTLTARQDGSPCIDRGQEIVVERCDAFLPLAGDKAGSVAFATSPTACVVGIDIYNGATTGNVSKTLNSAATDSDHIPCVIGYDARGNKDGKVAPTITGDHNGHMSDYTAIVCFSQDAYDKYEEAQHAASLKASGGNYGGGSENLVCAGFSAQSSAEAGLTFNENLSPTLQVGKCAAVVTEHHTHEKVVRMREGKDGGGKGALVQKDKSGTIACNNDQVLFQKAETQYIVRRLTPLECCRFQGMPDFWTDGVEGSDAARYKLWGNGMALPNALYVMEGVAEAKSRRRNKNGIL